MEVSHRILVVFEDAITLERLKKHLVEQRFSVLGVCSAAKAITAAEHWAPELVICESNLDGLTGIELSEKIRVLHPRVRFIMITPPGETPEFVRPGGSRIVAFLGKPFNPEDLMHFVHGAFSAGEPQSNRREHNRHSFTIEAHLTLINPFDNSESRPIASLMRDVSRSGVAMIVRQILPVPTMLRISFSLGASQSMIPMLAKSVSCTLTQIPGVYRLGAKFIGLLPCELEKTLVKMSTPNEGTEGKDIFMGKTFKDAALEWLEGHQADFPHSESGYSPRAAAEMAQEFSRNPTEDDSLDYE